MHLYFSTQMKHYRYLSSLHHIDYASPFLKQAYSLNDKYHAQLIRVYYSVLILKFQLILQISSLSTNIFFIWPFLLRRFARNILQVQKKFCKIYHQMQWLIKSFIDTWFGQAFLLFSFWHLFLFGNFFLLWISLIIFFLLIHNWKLRRLNRNSLLLILLKHLLPALLDHFLSESCFFVFFLNIEILKLLFNFKRT